MDTLSDRVNEMVQDMAREAGLSYTHLDDNRIMKYVESTVKQRLTRRLMQSKQAAIMDKYEQENARLQAKIEELEAAELNTTEVEQFMTESNGSLPVGLDVEKNN